jgi:hypothetical protein
MLYERVRHFARAVPESMGFELQEYLPAAGASEGAVRDRVSNYDALKVHCSGSRSEACFADA